MHPIFLTGFALALSAPLLATAQTAANDIDGLRQEIAAIRNAYEARLQALEQRLKAAQANTGGSAPAMAAVPPPSAVTPPVATPPATAPASAGANAFNPSISLILSGLVTRTSRDPAQYAIKGFALADGAETGPGTRGFSLAETELGLSANIDPWLRGAVSIALHGDDSVSVEEAFVQTTSLGGGLTLKAGRFFAGIGYLNPKHAHTWDFVDNPLAYQALLGTQLSDDGVQLSWLAPIDHYLELTAEMGRGRGVPGSDSSRNGAGRWSLAAHTGGDVGASHNWRAGLSVLSAKAEGLGLVSTDAAGGTSTNFFSGNTRVWIADAVWKWAPNGNATRTNFKLQGEYLRSTRSGSLDDGAGVVSDGRGVQSGWYAQGIYQFMPRWRAGMRVEQLDDGTGLKPRKNTLMLDFNPSEFSRVRLQFAQDRANFGAADRQLFLQYQMSLGAHGAHGY